MIYLQDTDFTLHLGDVLSVLREMPSESVDCVITSPPYWGLRDYGTGAWDGGDEKCDHEVVAARNGRGGSGSPGKQTEGAFPSTFAASECGKCGATRQDAQLGLEPTPEQYVERMTEVFREVRRVLAAHGTCWLNMGDSYSGAGYSNHENTGGAQREDGGKQAHLLSSATGLKPKDLCGIPWRLAFALQADGWYLRSDIVWSKPNPMPESVTDRPTKAHEYVFLLTKSPRYFFDQEAVREPLVDPHRVDDAREGYASLAVRHNGARGGYMRPPSGARNIRSVWEIATQPYPEAHFATFPEELVRRCLLAGCPEQVCGECGKARERVVERGELVGSDRGGNYKGREAELEAARANRNHGTPGLAYELTTTGFTDCGHDAYRPGVCLDIFMGSGTTALVARKHGRRAVGIELNAEYCELIVKRTQQLSLLSELA